MLFIVGVMFATLAQPAPCEALAALSLTGTTITASELIAAGPARGGRGAAGAPLPAHCRVAATLTPVRGSRITMEVWLPVTGWNGKFLAVGNGGWGGTLDTAAMAAGLRRGFATAANDTGHNGRDMPNGSFALGQPEKVVDFAYRAMHEMTVKSKEIIRAFYTRDASLSYFQGCSTGGRQGLMAAQRYPADFDAIIAGAPVHNMLHLNTSQLSLQIDMLRDASLLMTPAKAAVVADAVTAACDLNDGVRDGIISEPDRCRFDPAVLLCPNGDGPACLTAGQVESAKRAYSPVRDSAGTVVYPGHPPGFERGWRLPTPGAPLNPLMADTPRFLGHQDANWDVMTFDLKSDLELARARAGFVEATNPDLSAFKARGGKLILYHGAADPGPAPENTINYATSVEAALGGAQDNWMRVFVMPGVGHCRGGVGPDSADFLGAIDAWRAKGTAPDTIAATRDARDGDAALSRPLCAHPLVARYSGTGDVRDAANFRCVKPQPR